MRPKDQARAQQLSEALKHFHQHKYPLPGIQNRHYLQSLLEQLLESIHRIEFVTLVGTRPISANRADPSSEAFDPLRAAMLHQQAGRIDEAFWLVFIFVHFGKNRRTGWRLARDVYGALGGQPWTWARTSANPAAFQQWLASRQVTLAGRDGIARHFGNHRKYQSLDATSSSGTGAAFLSYVGWVGPTKSHAMVMQQALQQCAGSPRLTFDYLYSSMSAVKSFGRTAKFDYLTMIGKLGLAPIEPGSTYMQGATGPAQGARLLFGDAHGALSLKELDARLIQLGGELNVGMQVLEDSLCNWQKSPKQFQPFRG